MAGMKDSPWLRNWLHLEDENLVPEYCKGFLYFYEQRTWGETLRSNE